MKTLHSKFLPPALALLALGVLQLHAQFLEPVLPPRIAAPRALALPAATPNTLVVTSDKDSGPSTLRQAVADAAPGDTIRFALKNGKSFGFDDKETIALKSSLLIDKDLNIVGPGPAKLLIARSTKKKTPAFRVFDISAGQVVISGVSIFNGRALNPDGASDNLGGGILNFGSLTLSNCVLSHNEARTENGGVGFGGAVFSVGPLRVFDCTISDNHVSGAGGGISTFASPDFVVERSTISGNSAAVQGGGINFQGALGTLRNSTISGNITSPDGAASGLLMLTFPGQTAGLDISACTIARNIGGTNAVVAAALPGSFLLLTRIKSTILAENDAQNFAFVGSSFFFSQGNNLDTDGTTGIANGVNGDLAGTLTSPLDARLGSLAFYGGPTRTHTLLAGSPAVDVGAATDAAGLLITTDQRGAARPQGPASDIGAFENQAPVLTCPALLTLDCGDQMSVTVSDPDGDALALVWSVDGTDVQTNFLAATKPSTSRTIKLSVGLAAGPHTVSVRVSDGKAATVDCATSVTVRDTKAPKIKKLTATPSRLTPALGQLVPVVISAVVEDCGPTSCRIISVQSSDPLSPLPDWIITGDLTLQLRAKVSGKKERLYTITVECADSAGLKARKTVTVKVEKGSSTTTSSGSGTTTGTSSGTTDGDDDDLPIEQR